MQSNFEVLVSLSCNIHPNIASDVKCQWRHSVISIQKLSFSFTLNLTDAMQWWCYVSDFLDAKLLCLSFAYVFRWLISCVWMWTRFWKEIRSYQNWTTGQTRCRPEHRSLRAALLNWKTSTGGRMLRCDLTVHAGFGLFTSRVLGLKSYCI